jgi:hypothetical protein
MICKVCKTMVGRSNLTDEGVCKDKIRCTENLKDRGEFEDSPEPKPFDFRAVKPSSLGIPQQRHDNE